MAFREGQRGFQRKEFVGCEAYNQHKDERVGCMKREERVLKLEKEKEQKKKITRPW